MNSKPLIPVTGPFVCALCGANVPAGLTIKISCDKPGCPVVPEKKAP